MYYCLSTSVPFICRFYLFIYLLLKVKGFRLVVSQLDWDLRFYEHALTRNPSINKSYKKINMCLILSCPKADRKGATVNSVLSFEGFSKTLWQLALETWNNLKCEFFSCYCCEAQKLNMGFKTQQDSWLTIQAYNLILNTTLSVPQFLIKHCFKCRR